MLAEHKNIFFNCLIYKHLFTTLQWDTLIEVNEANVNAEMWSL